MSLLLITITKVDFLMEGDSNEYEVCLHETRKAP